MITYRDVYSHKGHVGVKSLVKVLQKLPYNAVMLVCARLCQAHYRLVSNTSSTFTSIGQDLKEYNKSCMSLLESTAQAHFLSKKLDIIFPEISIIHVIKLAQLYCDKDEIMTDDPFPNEVLLSIGECILISNTLLHDAQEGKTPEERKVAFTRQLIVDHDLDSAHQLYAYYNLYAIHSKDLKYVDADFDIEAYFQAKFNLSVEEFFALAFGLYSNFSRFLQATTIGDITALPNSSYSTLFSNLPSKFARSLLDALLIENAPKNLLGDAFFDPYAITQYPLCRLDDFLFVTSYKRFIARISESIYFDILDTLETKEARSKFSSNIGHAWEAFCHELLKMLDPTLSLNAQKPHGSGKSLPDAEITIGNSTIIVECKKRPFHTQEFITCGTPSMYDDRFKEYFIKPVRQHETRASELLKNEGLQKLYFLVITPVCPPIFAGTMHEEGDGGKILSETLQSDERVMFPEYMGMDEFGAVVAYLDIHKEISLVDLINEKKLKYEYTNWSSFLATKGVPICNPLLMDAFIEKIEDFTNLLFPEQR